MSLRGGTTTMKGEEMEYLSLNKIDRSNQIYVLVSKAQSVMPPNTETDPQTNN
jgi:hypothetical protein